MKVRTVTAIAVAPIALSLLAAGPASAATPAPQTVQAAKTLVDSRIDGRLHTLDALKTAIAGAGSLSSGHRSTLSTLISTDSTKLTALRAKVDGETTLQAIRDDEHSMVVDYRIYMLVVPKVRFTIGSDDETAAIEKLQDAKGKLADAIAAAQGKGKDVSAEQAELTDLTNQLGAATAALSGKVDTLLTVAPSADAAAMTAAVTPVRAAVHTARTDLAKGVADAKQIRKQLS
jgi:hypothetical protein